MNRLFGLAIFCSATLLFMVQPLVAKILLPVLGGSPAVWSTCMVFFQAVLLLGYLYAHLLSTRLVRRWQGPVHIAVLVVASLLLPLPMAVGEPGAANPRWWTLRALALTVGLRFFALSATAPLLQRWYSRTNDPRATDPYFLYATSNAGSLLGLLAYPLVEPFATRSAESTGWSVGFWSVAVLVAVCAYASLPAASVAIRKARVKPVPIPPAVPPSRLVLWVLLALVPSALLLGVTEHLTTDIVSAPLLWVVPLALYLITFMAAFSSRGFGSAQQWGAMAPVAALLVMVLSLAEVRDPILPITLAHLSAFAVLAMLCHTRLAETRPAPVHLTRYFLCISLGGVLGGVMAALVAPVVFSSILEYPIGIAAALLLRPQTLDADQKVPSARGRWAWRLGAVLLLVGRSRAVFTHNQSANTEQLTSSGLFTWLQTFTGDTEVTERLVRASFAIPAGLLLFRPRTALLFAGTAAGLLVGAGVTRTGGDVLDRERTFFGVHQVTSTQGGAWHELTHGTTLHGVQATRGKVHFLPTAYYHPTGPLGDLVFTLVPDGRFHDVGAVGLGAGALAAYAGNGTRIDFFEIDEAVIRIAENPDYFTYLADARARPGVTVRTMAVDGRIGLKRMQTSYDLLVIDAFSSDAIPTHLITREAVALYETRLKTRGVIAFHVSSRFFNLAPVLARIADDLQLVCYARDDHDVPPDRAAEAMRPSVWVVLARNGADLGQLAEAAPRWVRLASSAGDPLWTDDYTNVLGALGE